MTRTRMKRLPNVPPPRLPLDNAGVTRLIEENWRLSAACRSADPELFFPVSSIGKSLEQTVEAKAVCAPCLVRRQCLDFALRTRQAHGVWGGMTEEERNSVTPEQRAAAAGRTR